MRRLGILEQGIIEQYMSIFGTATSSLRQIHRGHRNCAWTHAQIFHIHFRYQKKNRYPAKCDDIICILCVEWSNFIHDAKTTMQRNTFFSQEAPILCLQTRTVAFSHLFDFQLDLKNMLVYIWKHLQLLKHNQTYLQYNKTQKTNGDCILICDGNRW